MVPKVAAAWHICLVVAERLLDGSAIGPIVGQKARNHGADELHDAYAEELGVTDTAEGVMKTKDVDPGVTTPT